MLSGETCGARNPYGGRPPLARIAFVRICSRYFSHGAWLEEAMLLRDARELADVPAVLVHGRLDMGGPLVTAWQLYQAWPEAKLIVVEGAGHLGTVTTRGHVLEALDAMATD